MKCSDPVLCYTDGKTRKYRNWSLASEIIRRSHILVFDCGKCVFCRKNSARELAMRCVLHASCYEKNCFLTLTYDESLDGYHNEFNYSDVQKFKKRLRKKVSHRIEIFNVHEYGKNGKKHWHLVVFGYDFDDKIVHTYKNSIPLYTSQELNKIWPYGFSSIGDVSEASAMYQAQYMEKDIINGNSNNKKKSHSKHSGIGKKFFLQNYKQILELGFIPFEGKKVPLPRYFEKLAHKHWAHFYDQSFFFDNDYRKKRYSPFKLGEQNKEIADLFISYEKVVLLKFLHWRKNGIIL